MQLGSIGTYAHDKFIQSLIHSVVHTFIHLFVHTLNMHALLASGTNRPLDSQ